MLRLVLIALLAGSGPAAAAHAPRGAERQLIVANDSPLGIIELHVSPESSTAWGPNRLSGRRLAPGRTLRLRLGRSPECAWDVAVTYEDDSTEELRGVDACQGRRALFDGANATTAPKDLPGDPHQVIVVNRSARPIMQIFVSPTAAEGWGENQLATEGVAPGAGATVVYRGPCVADIRVVFDNDAAEERPDIDICKHAAIAIKPGWTTGDDIDAHDVISPPKSARRT